MSDQLTLPMPAEPLPPLTLDGARQAIRIAALNEIAVERRWAVASVRAQRFSGHRPGMPSDESVSTWFRRDLDALAVELRERLASARAA